MNPRAGGRRVQRSSGVRAAGAPSRADTRLPAGAGLAEDTAAYRGRALGPGAVYPQGPPRERRAPPLLPSWPGAAASGLLGSAPLGAARDGSGGRGPVLGPGAAPEQSVRTPRSSGRPALCLETGISKDRSALTLRRLLLCCALAGRWGHFVGVVAP